MPLDQKHVGRRYGPYSYPVGLESIRNFAAAVSGGVPGRLAWTPADAGPAPHPFHWDEAAARGSPYGTVIAPPTYAATFAMQAFAAALADPAVGVDVSRVVHGEQELELLLPVRPGDVMETTGEITSIQQKGSLDLLTVTTTSRNQRGELAVRGTWTAAVRG
jgi:acyl dehydratase